MCLGLCCFLCCFIMKNILFLSVVLLCSALVSALPAPACVGEGDSYAVVPPHMECCPGLTAIGCSAPDAGGVCVECVGAMYCTYCGDGVCGLGENKCNCPVDCDVTPAPEFASLGLLLFALVSAPAAAYVFSNRGH